MQEGIITALNLNEGEITIHGNRLRFNHATVRVFSSAGVQVGLQTLRKGENIRFLLDPKDVSEQTISVIYQR